MTGLEEIPFNPEHLGICSQDHFQNRRQGLTDVDLYIRDNTYLGIKVADEFTNRMIPKDTDMSEVFKPLNRAKVYCFNIFPGSTDITEYQEVLQEIADGDAILESQDKHPTDKGFVVMLVVNYARMIFRKEDYREDYPKVKVPNE